MTYGSCDIRGWFEDPSHNFKLRFELKHIGGAGGRCWEKIINERMSKLSDKDSFKVHEGPIRKAKRQKLALQKVKG